MSGRSALKNLLLNVLLVAVSTTIVLLGVELFLVYDDRRPNLAEYTSTIKLNGVTYRFLDSEAALNDARSAVLIVGDSFTAGGACADKETYPSAFTKAATKHGAGVRGINMGVAGTGPISYALRVKDYLAEKNTAAGVILTLYANDIEIDCEACRNLGLWSEVAGLSDAEREKLEALCHACLTTRGQRVSGDVPLGRRINWWFADHLRVYQVLRESGARLAVGAGLLDVEWGRGAFPERWSDVEGIYFKQIRAAITLVKREADRRGVPLLVVIYPDPINITSQNQFVEIYERARKSLSEATAVPVYSGYEAFFGDQRTRPHMAFSLTDTHPNCEAHEIFGNWVYQKWTATRVAGAQ